MGDLLSAGIHPKIALPDKDSSPGCGRLLCPACELVESSSRIPAIVSEAPTPPEQECQGYTSKTHRSNLHRSVTSYFSPSAMRMRKGIPSFIVVWIWSLVIPSQSCLSKPSRASEGSRSSPKREVSERSQPPLTSDSSLSEQADYDSLHRSDSAL